MWDNWPEMQGETPLSRDDFAMRFAYDTGYKHSMQEALPLSASCSSRQRFASGFLPTPGHPGNRCFPLTLAQAPGLTSPAAFERRFPRVATATGALQQRVLIKMAVGTRKIENFSEFP